MENDKTIVEYGRILYLRRWPIVILLVAIFGFTLINTLFTPKRYTAKATIFPTTANQGGLASFLSSTLAGVVKQDANVVVVLLKSRSMAETVVQKLKLKGKAAYTPQKNIQAYVTKDGAVEICLEDNNPQLAENIVNTYINSLSEYLNEKAISINFVVVDSAKASSFPSSPNLKMNLIAAIVVSLVLGISFSLLDDYFRLVIK